MLFSGIVSSHPDPAYQCVAEFGVLLNYHESARKTATSIQRQYPNSFPAARSRVVIRLAENTQAKICRSSLHFVALRYAFPVACDPHFAHAANMKSMKCGVSNLRPDFETGCPELLKSPSRSGALSVFLTVPVLLLVLAECMSSAYALSSPERFSKIKQILDADWAEYDVVYSSLQHWDEWTAKAIEGLNKIHAPAHLEPHLGEAHFIYVRNARDGYFMRSALSLEHLRSSVFKGESITACAVYSNTSFWSFANQILLTEDTFVPPKGFDWQDLRDRAEENISTLGLPIVKHSIVWNGTNFIADENRTLPEGKGPRKVVGFIDCKDGLPSVIHADMPNLRLHRDIYLGDATIKQSELELPKKWDIVDTPGSGRTHKWTYELVDFSPTNFPPGSTMAQVIAGDPGAAPVTVIHQYPDGRRLILQEAGQKVTPRPMNPRGQLLEY
jgi:hypothetical protein